MFLWIIVHIKPELLVRSLVHKIRHVTDKSLLIRRWASTLLIHKLLQLLHFDFFKAKEAPVITFEQLLYLRVDDGVVVLEAMICVWLKLLLEHLVSHEVPPLLGGIGVNQTALGVELFWVLDTFERRAIL